MAEASLSEWFSRAKSLIQQGDLQQAELILQQLLAKLPSEPRFLYLLGVVQLQSSNIQGAVALLQQADSVSPNNVEILNVLGAALQAQGDLDKALSVFGQIVALDPSFASAYNNLGVIYKQKSKFKQAESNYRKAVELVSGFGDAWNNLGFVLQDQARIAEAVTCFESAVKSGNCSSRADSNVLMAVNYSDQLSREEIYSKHRTWGKALEHGKTFLSDLSKARANKKYRLGFVSGDFRIHSVAYFIDGLFEHLDRSRFELLCFYNYTKNDAMTQRLKSFADHWFDIAHFSDQQLSSLVQEQSVDVLIDLSGHSGKNRLGMFVHHPASIQVTWLGYPHSTGLKAIDYRIVDALTDPCSESQALHSEKLLYLNDCFLAYRGNQAIALSQDIPSEKNGYVTFGSFNNAAKLSPSVLAVWMDLLKQMPNSRLMIKSSVFSCHEFCDQFLRSFEHEGIARTRLVLKGSITSDEDHMRCYDEVDVALDSFPYNGTTTTFEALWMGVPVVSLAGDRHAARVGLSILSNLGYSEWVGTDAADYIAISLKLAADSDLRRILRSSLRKQLENSILCDQVSFARRFEAAIESIL